jgi:hypothetical protein
MQYRDDNGQLRYAFDSLNELGEYIHRERRTWTSRSSETHDPSRDWDLGAGYAASVEMARNGWLEGASKVQDALKAFPPATPAPEDKVDFYGHRPHVPRFCAGAPDSMIRHARDAERGFRPVLTLGVPVNALGYVGAREMANFGVAVAQYVNQLEAQGMRVELIGMMVSQVSGRRVAHSWTIKHADQPLDLAVVAFSIGHPAMFRRLGFALRERCNAPTDPIYGRTMSAKVSDLINPPVGTVILNGMAEADQYAPTPEAALEYVTKQIDTAIEQQEL